MQCPLRNANVPSATYDLSKYFYWSDESFFSQIRDIKNKYETPGTISNHELLNGCELIIQKYETTTNRKRGAKRRVFYLLEFHIFWIINERTFNNSIRK